MSAIRPFKAIRPSSEYAAQVIAPPYDVLSLDEARAEAQEPRSFVHVTRSEVDLPEGTDSHSELAYQKARENLDAMRANKTLIQDAEPTYYLYGQKMGAHHQVAVVAGASVAEYDAGLIKKHEYTRPDKEADRTHHMEVLGAQVGLVFLTYRQSPQVDAVIQKITQGEPEWVVTTPDQVEHTLWLTPQDQVQALTDAFAAVDALYVADGHHRSAAASRVHKALGTEQSAYFLAGLIPDDALQVFAYNRVVNDLNGRDSAAFLAEVEKAFVVEPGPQKPTAGGTFSMYLDGSWRKLTLRDDVPRREGPVAALDVSVLQDHLLGPILGIDDPRTSTRIQFVGGIRGPEALQQAVDAGAKVAFHLYPTPLSQLFEVADAGDVMPPKSTWFEPKLREGVVVRSL